jgi:hypothetical protein
MAIKVSMEPVCVTEKKNESYSSIHGTFIRYEEKKRCAETEMTIIECP